MSRAIVRAPAAPDASLLDAVGKPVKVHWHITKRLYSIASRSTGKVIGYAPACELADVKFHIDPRLQRAFKANPRRRTVHALVKGTLVSCDPQPVDGDRVLCNPFRFDTFVRHVDFTPVWKAEHLALYADRRMIAIGVVSDPDSYPASQERLL